MPLPLAAIGTAGFRVPRALSRAAPDGSPCGGRGKARGRVRSRRRRRGRCRVGAQRRVHRLPLAVARLRRVAGRIRQPRSRDTRRSAACSSSRWRRPSRRRRLRSSSTRWPRPRARASRCSPASAVVAAGGAALARIEWTAPAGAPVAVSLVQGNVLQDVKFDPDDRQTTLRLYAELVAASRGRLVVLPESAFPVFADEVPEGVLVRMLDTLTAARRRRARRNVHRRAAAAPGATTCATTTAS